MLISTQKLTAQLLKPHNQIISTKNKGDLSIATISSHTKVPFMPIYLSKYLSKSPLNALPCLASSWIYRATSLLYRDCTEFRGILP